jgi:hypothetical protein
LALYILDQFAERLGDDVGYLALERWAGAGAISRPPRRYSSVPL